jgi:hypothetical protein
MWQRISGDGSPTSHCLERHINFNLINFNVSVGVMNTAAACATLVLTGACAARRLTRCCSLALLELVCSRLCCATYGTRPALAILSCAHRSVREAPPDAVRCIPCAARCHTGHVRSCLARLSDLTHKVALFARAARHTTAVHGDAP